MKPVKECIPCQRKRAMLITKNLSEEKKKELTKRINVLFSNLDMNRCTIDIANERNRIIKEIAGKDALMDDLREDSMKAAEKISPNLEQDLEKIKDEEERFCKALRIALAGNVIEFGTTNHVVKIGEIEKRVHETIKQEPAIDDSRMVYEIVQAYNHSNRILYLVDNAAEIAFDRLFIKELVKHAIVVIAALSEPDQDDACVENLKRFGIDKIPNCEIITKGKYIGAYFPNTTKQFKVEFEKADLIISKGMGNYESLSEYSDKIINKVVFMLKLKCGPVADSFSDFFNIGNKLEVGANVIKFASKN
ncbi:MAG: DUF89 family protein [Nanoarchaeota archaeon]|nr:DUF89 family protein [Nanoarchaeota archaeon]